MVLNSTHRQCPARIKTLAYGITVGLLAAYAPVRAQTPVATTSATEQKVEQIVITGSRIVRRDLDSPSPILTTSKDALAESGSVTIEQSLNQLPQFTPGGTAANGGQGQGARATLNLRGLGDNRNLVLLDGHRLPLSSSFGQVDVNVVPQSVLESVETITGGASAVYGSDAMSGVVNFKTLPRFKGVQLDLQYGNSTKQDNRKVDPSLTAGTDFADGRGYALLSLSFTDRQSLPGRSRPFFALGVPSGFIGTGLYVPDASNLPTQAAVNSLFSGYGIATVVPRNNNLGFNDNGSLFSQTGAVNYKGPTTGDYAIVAGNVRMPVLPQGDLLNALRRHTILSKFNFKFTPDVTGYAQYLHTESVAHTNSGGTLTQFGVLPTIPVTNPFIPADLRTLLNSRPNPNAAFTWNDRYVGVPAKQWDERFDTSQLLVGVRGPLPIRDWTYDVYASTDETRHTQLQFNAVLKSRVQTLFNAADGGNSICAGGFNPFGIANQKSMSAACANYITTTAMSTEKLTQTIGEAAIQGGLFELPAGDVRFSLSTDFRKNTYDYIPDANLAAQNIEAVIASQPSHGSTMVKEIAGELRVPIFEDAPFAEKLDVDFGYRHSDYDVTGSANAYKADVEWKPASQLLIRGGYQKAIRAPNIGELFSAASGGQVQFGSPPAGGEPCDIRTLARTGANGAQVRALCIAQGIPVNVVDNYVFPTVATSTLSSGNKALKPETAQTKTIGFVFTPETSMALFSKVALSVDYYNIKIKDTISAVPGASAINKCFNLDGSNPTYSPSNPFCRLLHRDPNGQLSQVDTPYLNLGQLNTSGVDLTADWRFKLSQIGLPENSGSFGINVALSYLKSYKQQALPGDPVQEFAGTVGATTGIVILPKWQSLTTFRYDLGPMDLALRWRHIPSMYDITSVTRPASPTAGVKKYDLFDLTGKYDVSKTLQLRAGINNLFNRQPQLVPGQQNLTIASTYDIIGRSYYVGARLRFN